MGHTTDDHPDFPNLLEAQETIAVVARDTNESFRLVELSRKILEIQVGCGSESGGGEEGRHWGCQRWAESFPSTDLFRLFSLACFSDHFHALTRTHTHSRSLV